MGRGLEQTPFPRRHSQQTYEKMFDFTSYYGNAVRYHLISVSVAITNKTGNNKCWKGCGKKGTLIHCSGKCKLVQPPQKTVWWFLKTTIIKNRVSIGQRDPFSRYLPLKTQIHVFTKVHVLLCLLQHYSWWPRQKQPVSFDR